MFILLLHIISFLISISKEELMDVKNVYICALGVKQQITVNNKITYIPEANNAKRSFDSLPTPMINQKVICFVNCKKGFISFQPYNDIPGSITITSILYMKNCSLCLNNLLQESLLNSCSNNTVYIFKNSLSMINPKSTQLKVKSESDMIVTMGFFDSIFDSINI